MSYKKVSNLFRLFSIFISLSVMTVSTFPVYATDSIDSLEESTSNLEQELNTLNQDLRQLDQEISSIAAQIASVTEKSEEIRSELALAKGQEEVQYTSMKTRIQYMYENGNESIFEMLLSARSIADFIKRAEYFSMIYEYDRQAMEELNQTQEQIRIREQQLQEEQNTLLSLQESLNQKEQALMNQISSTEGKLSNYKARLEAAKEEARKAQEALNEKIEPVAPPKPESSVPMKPEVSAPSQEPAPSESGGEGSVSASASDIEIFAALIECEAGSTDYEGMLAVASVVVNRMNARHYPDTLRGVIYQSGQFPPAHDGKVDRVLRRGVKDACITVANDALSGKNNVGDCLSFRSASSGHQGLVIGSNVFF